LLDYGFVLRVDKLQHTTFRRREQEGLRPDTTDVEDQTAIGAEARRREILRTVSHGQPSDIGPAVTFAATVLVTFAALAAAAVTLPRDAIMPAVSLLFFMFAGITALAAWRLGQTPRHRALSYWDVAGALTSAPRPATCSSARTSPPSRAACWRGWRARSKMGRAGREARGRRGLEPITGKTGI
jgi:hypothetical protein